VNKKEFQNVVWEKGHELYRDMPWRQDTRPYYVLLSEMMLQQTQVGRVIPKFHEFIERFPDIYMLAAASLSDVLSLWSGLGYNRRAKYLHEAAKKIVNEFGGVFPETKAALISLPGIGENTAGALLAYSFNQPSVFIETNIRTVYFYHFFPEGDIVDDKQLRDAVTETVDVEHPREWYWALMDYGTFLKQQGIGSIRQSKHYKKQSPLKGSLREVRGLILKSLRNRSQSEAALRTELPQDDRFGRALAALIDEGLVIVADGQLHLGQ